jgi:vacuolar-type H+-ATPase subunit H
VILAAEAEARQAVDAAQRDCQGLVREAEEDSRRRVHEAGDTRDALAQSVEERLVAAAQQNAVHMAEGTRLQAAAMQARAGPRIDAAVEAVVHFVLTANGQGDAS